ncbi:MAG TPA: YraN family protein [bacterium]|nr:YraN family protein [bacterium]
MDKTKNKLTGNSGEDAAANYLESISYKLLARNLRLPFGEIDILAEERGTIVIVEVKTVRGSGFGLAQELVRFKKQNKLLLLGRAMEQQYPGKAIRIDVIGIDMSENPPRIEHLISAVER